MSDTLQNALSLLVKPANADCNMACRYCFYTPKKGLFPGSLSPAIHKAKELIAKNTIGQVVQVAALIYQNWKNTKGAMAPGSQDIWRWFSL